MKTAEIRKQISIFLPLSDWRAIRREAARLRIPMTELCRRWMQADMSRLPRPDEMDDPEAGRRMSERQSVRS